MIKWFVVLGIIVLIVWLMPKRTLPEDNYLTEEAIEELIEAEKRRARMAERKSK